MVQRRIPGFRRRSRQVGQPVALVGQEPGAPGGTIFHPGRHHRPRTPDRARCLEKDRQDGGDGVRPGAQRFEVQPDKQSVRVQRFGRFDRRLAVPPSQAGELAFEPAPGRLLVLDDVTRTEDALVKEFVDVLRPQQRVTRKVPVEDGSQRARGQRSGRTGTQLGGRMRPWTTPEDLRSISSMPRRRSSRSTSSRPRPMAAPVLSPASPPSL